MPLEMNMTLDSLQTFLFSAFFVVVWHVTFHKSRPFDLHQISLKFCSWFVAEARDEAAQRQEDAPHRLGESIPSDTTSRTATRLPIATGHFATLKNLLVQFSLNVSFCSAGPGGAEELHVRIRSADQKQAEAHAEPAGDEASKLQVHFG